MKWKFGYNERLENKKILVAFHNKPGEFFIKNSNSGLNERDMWVYFSELTFLEQDLLEQQHRRNKRKELKKIIKSKCLREFNKLKKTEHFDFTFQEFEELFLL